MTCFEYDLQIDEYVEGTLPATRVAALEAHLATCSRCRAAAADFRTLRSAASTLERRNPPPEVWTRVVASIHESSEQTGWFSWMLPGLTWRSAVAAAVIVIMLTVGTWFSWHEAATAGRVVSTAGLDTASAESRGVEQAMRTQISDMEKTVRTASAVLPSETQAAYQQAGAVIDDALSRRASEPHSEVTQQSLLELLQSKLRLLQEMIALINEMRKGNQEEAARIVSGIEQ
ncbi:MAG TPA: zf-HC2 domain-containing protein [Vicinamibacterales bacterium]|nr:zf-HC2 domain-containing protein [Vicinamibacterales bacterium]